MIMVESNEVMISRMINVLRKHMMAFALDISYRIYSYHIHNFEYIDREAWEENRCSSKAIIEDKIESMSTEDALSFLEIARQNILSILKANPHRHDAKITPSNEFYEAFIIDCTARYGILMENNILRGLTETEFLSLPAVKEREISIRASAYYWIDLLEWIDKRRKNVDKGYTNQDIETHMESGVNIKREVDTSLEVLAHLTQRQLALYYVYLHITDTFKSFEDMPEGKVAAMASVVKPFGKSVTPFQKFYNALIVSLVARTENVDDLKVVSPLLREYPKAVERITDELRKAEIDALQSR